MKVCTLVLPRVTVAHVQCPAIDCSACATDSDDLVDREEQRSDLEIEISDCN